MADRSSRYPVDMGGSNVPLRSSSSSSRRPPRNTPLSQQLHAPQQQQQQQQQQHQQHQPSQRQQSQQSLFTFNVDFDLVGPLGTGLSADATGGAGGGDGRGHLGHSGGVSAGGANGHSGSTSVKSAVVRSSPSFTALQPAKQHDSTESKAEPRHVSSNNSTAHQHHQYLPYAGNNSTAAVHNNNSTRRIAPAETAPRRDDHLFSNDLEAAMPYFVDFGGESDSSGGEMFSAGTNMGTNMGTGAVASIDMGNSTGDRPKRGATMTGRSTSSSVASIPALDDGKQDSSLGMLDDVFTPTLMTSRPAGKSPSVRERQEQQQQQHQHQHQQHQHQHQHQPLQQSLQDSSLDFFSSLESTLPSNSTRSSTRSSSSSSPFAQLSSAAPLPSFPTMINDYSSLGRGNSHTRTAPARRTSQSNTAAYTSLESVPPSSASFSAAYGGLGHNGNMDTSASLASHFTPASQQRRKNNLPVPPSPFSSASFASATPSVAGPSNGHMEPKAFSSAPSPSSDNMPAPSSPGTTTSGSDFSSHLDAVAFAAPTPPKITPKPSAKVPSQPQHSPRQPIFTAGLKSDPLLQTHRQTSHHPTSRRTGPAPVSQPIKTTVQAMPHHQNSYPTPSPPSPPPPPPQAPPPMPPSLQMPPSPWLEDDDDFYHASMLPSLTSTAAPAAPSPAPVEATIPVSLPTPTPVPAQVVSPVPVPRESTRTPQPPHIKLPKASEEQKQEQQQQSKQPKQPKLPKQQAAPPTKIRKQPPPPLSPKQETQTRQANLEEQPKSPPMSPAALSPAFTKYPPPPPLILYSDDQITISSLHLTIHAFYFPLNTPLTIPLLSITELETLPSAENEGGNSGGMAGWLKYKNWGVSALSDIWWARDPRQTTSATTTSSGGNLLTSTLGAAAAAVTVAMPLSRYSNKENTAPLVHVVVRVEGEWLRKGFGVEHERGVQILKDAWKNVKESELGLRPLRPSMTGPASDGGDDLFVVERAGGDNQRQHHSNNSSNNHAGGSSEKRRWLTYQNTWTAYPFADDSPQFLAQQQRRGGVGGAGVGVVGAIGATLAAKAPRYRPQQRQRTGFGPQSTSLHFGPDESCGDEPLFIDNDLNVHEEI